jgi:hypothetical protein
MNTKKFFWVVAVFCKLHPVWYHLCCRLVRGTGTYRPEDGMSVGCPALEGADSVRKLSGPVPVLGGTVRVLTGLKTACPLAVLPWRERTVSANSRVLSLLLPTILPACRTNSNNLDRPLLNRSYIVGRDHQTSTCRYHDNGHDIAFLKIRLRPNSKQ